MGKNIISQNPFDDLPDYREGQVEKNLSMNIKGAMIENITKEIIESIDLNDRTFINRQLSLEDSQKNQGIDELTESIYYAGLINPIYLQKKDNNKFRVLSGFRRSLAIKNGYENYEDFSIEGQCVIVPYDTDKYELELVSIHENIYREDLKIIELAYKINKDARELGKTLEELSKDYGMSLRQTKRIKAAINYDLELKEILDSVGIKKAELLNRLIKLLRSDYSVADILDKYKEYNSTQLESEIKNIKSTQPKEEIEVKRDSKKTIIKINKEISEEKLEELKNFLFNI